MGVLDKPIPKIGTAEYVFPEGFIEQLPLKEQLDLVKLFKDFGGLGVRKWVGDWNKRFK